MGPEAGWVALIDDAQSVHGLSKKVGARCFVLRLEKSLTLLSLLQRPRKEVATRLKTLLYGSVLWEVSDRTCSAPHILYYMTYSHTGFSSLPDFPHSTPGLVVQKAE